MDVIFVYIVGRELFQVGHVYFGVHPSTFILPPSSTDFQVLFGHDLHLDTNRTTPRYTFMVVIDGLLLPTLEFQSYSFMVALAVDMETILFDFGVPHHFIDALGTPAVRWGRGTPHCPLCTNLLPPASSAALVIPSHWTSTTLGVTCWMIWCLDMQRLRFFFEHR